MKQKRTKVGSGVMHGIFFLGIVMIHVAGIAFERIFDRPMTPAATGLPFIIVHSVAGVAIGAHAWKMTKLKTARTARALKERTA